MEETTDELKPDDEISIPRCAELLGVSRATVFNAVRRNEIPSRKPSRDYLVKVRDCLAFKPKGASESGKLGAERRWGKPKRAATEENKPEE
jgi:hypothetical protein